MNIELQKLSCNSCGAPLEVLQSANFATCNHCSTQLAIRRTSTATFTEQLEGLATRQAELQERLRIAELDNQIARIDLEWQCEREQYLVGGNGGANQEPTETMPLIGLIFGFVGVVMLLASILAIEWLGPGLILVAFGLIYYCWGTAKVRGFKNAETRYQQKRKYLTRERSAEKPIMASEPLTADRQPPSIRQGA